MTYLRVGKAMDTNPIPANSRGPSERERNGMVCMFARTHDMRHTHRPEADRLPGPAASHLPPPDSTPPDCDFPLYSFGSSALLVPSVTRAAADLFSSLPGGGT